jgi:transposase-like protein
MQRRFEEVSGDAPAALEVLEGGLFDTTAVLALPDKYRRRLRTANMVVRFIEEIRRREKVVRIFPNSARWSGSSEPSAPKPMRSGLRDAAT